MSREAATDSIVGQVLQQTYRVTRKIAQGGMGAVFEAVHVRLPKKRYAIKVLLPTLAQRAIKRFRREAEITSELGHPHIVDVQDFNETPDGQPYMVMEYLEGEDMGQRLHARGCMPPAEVALLARQVGAALQAAHDHHVVHRDLKPANIYLVELERPEAPIYAKVLDFGISKITRAPTSETGPNTLLGTAHYMSPEQANGFPEEIDHTTDIFALGTICYQALCGELPFDAPSIPGVIYRIRYEAHRPLGERMPGLPPEVDEVLTCALAKERSQRYMRVSDFAGQLAELLEGLPAADDAAPGPRPIPEAKEELTRTMVGLGADVAPPAGPPEPVADAARGRTLELVEGDGEARPQGQSLPSAETSKTTNLAHDIGRPGQRTAMLALGALVAAALGIGAAVGLSRSDEIPPRSATLEGPRPLPAVTPGAPAAAEARVAPPPGRDAAPPGADTIARRVTHRPRTTPPTPPAVRNPEAAPSPTPPPRPDAAPPRPDAAQRRRPTGFERLHRPQPDAGASSAGFRRL